MDARTSRKETREQPGRGTVDVLMDNITDLYPVFADGDELLIMDIEILDDDRDELLDRAMFAVMKQRGADPTDPADGNQIEECIMGEITPLELIGQITASVLEAGPGVQASYSTSEADGKEYLTVALTLVPAV